jgi:hypothetical protein
MHLRASCGKMGPLGKRFRIAISKVLLGNIANGSAIFRVKERTRSRRVPIALQWKPGQ